MKQGEVRKILHDILCNTNFADEDEVVILTLVLAEAIVLASVAALMPRGLGKRDLERFLDAPVNFIRDVDKTRLLLLDKQLLLETIITDRLDRNIIIINEEGHA